MRVDRKKGEYFLVKGGQQLERVMSGWLLNIFMDGVMTEVKVRVMEQQGSLVHD